MAAWLVCVQRAHGGRGVDADPRCGGAVRQPAAGAVPGEDRGALRGGVAGAAGFRGQPGRAAAAASAAGAPAAAACAQTRGTASCRPPAHPRAEGLPLLIHPPLDCRCICGNSCCGSWITQTSKACLFEPRVHFLRSSITSTTTSSGSSRSSSRTPATSLRI
jgi:hypothetical protein